MEIQVPIGELKVHCYQILDNAQKEEQTLIITKRGTPIAEIHPYSPKGKKHSLFGMLQGKAKINGDLLKPMDIAWEAESDL